MDIGKPPLIQVPLKGDNTAVVNEEYQRFPPRDRAGIDANAGPGDRDRARSRPA
jgi:hypothetical protein